MNDQLQPTLNFEQTYERIKSILAEARQTAYRAVNSAMVAAYWEIGRVIVEEEQRGGERAEYGREVINNLASRLRSDFGKGFDRSNLWHMRSFYLSYPKFDAVRRELSWTHYRLLLRVENPDARSFYENEAINAQWSTRELERQIHSLLFERLALSRDRELAQEKHKAPDAPGPLEQGNGQLAIASAAACCILRYSLASPRRGTYKLSPIDE